MNLMEKIISLTKRRGFIYPGSEIYGGFAGTYDFGPYGVELRRNIIDMWLKAMREDDDIALLDSSIFYAPKVWEASGHTSGFTDLLVVCNGCRTKYRADHFLESIGIKADERMSETQIDEIFNANRNKIICPACGKKDFSEARAKNLLVSSNLGVLEGNEQEVYLRGETAQGIYINFKNVLDTGFYSVPFGIAQVGKVFRNEISPRQFLFRMREFEQMEMQYFTYPEKAKETYAAWKTKRMAYYYNLGVKKEKLRWKRHDNLSFYAKDAWDIQYEYPFGWGELEGLHYRGDYDLTQHQKFSGADMSVYDEAKKEHFMPHIIEASVGVERAMLMLLAEAYDEDEMNGEKRVVIRFAPAMAPIKTAVFPLLKNKPELIQKAKEVYKMVKKEIPQSMFDDNGNIGKRYRRQDEIGTITTITVDFETFDNNTVTLRDRDSAKQIRVSISRLTNTIKEIIDGRLFSTFPPEVI